VGNPAATLITSSPGLIARSLSLGEVNAEKARRFAEEPELVVIKNFTPKKSRNFFSKASLKRPVVSHQSREASTMLFNSAASKTLPDGGMTVSPGLKAWGVYLIFAYSSTRAAIFCLMSCCASSMIIPLIFSATDVF
jgi:hypothetical protein